MRKVINKHILSKNDKGGIWKPDSSNRRKIFIKALLCLLCLFFFGALTFPKIIQAEVPTTTVASESEFRNAVNNGGIISLSNDITVRNSLRITHDTTILGNGHTIKYTGSNCMFYVQATLNLGAKDNNQSLTLQGDRQSDCLLSVSGENGILNMYDGVTITENINIGTGGAIGLQDKSTFNMYGGTISNCSSEQGGALVVGYYSVFNMLGGTIENCTSNYCGGAVYTIDVGQFYMSGGTIKNCSAKFYGGGVCTDYYSYFVMNGGTIENCTAGFNGGGVANKWLRDSGSRMPGYYVEISGGKIIHNTALVGGGISLEKQGYSAAIDLRESVIANNHACLLDVARSVGKSESEAQGADIFLDNGAAVVMTSASEMKQVYEDDGKTSHGAIDTWYEDAKDHRFSITNPTNPVNEESITGPKYLIAAYIPVIRNISYTIEYNKNADDKSLVQNIPESETQTSSESSYSFNVSANIPKRENYIFLGWADSSDANSPKYNSGDTITLTAEDGQTEVKKNLYAVWASDDEYILNFDANGGTGGPATQHKHAGETGDSVSFSIPEDIPTRDGFTFLGWSNNNENKEVHFSKGGTITMSETTTGKQKTLYAVWISNENAEKKKDIPTVEKKVWNTTNAAWQDTTFAGVNNNTSDSVLSFKITGTLPANLESYVEDQTVETTNSESNENTQSQENVADTAGEIGSVAADSQNDTSSTGTKTPIYSSYTDYKFTDTYEAGITPNTYDLRVYLYNGENSTSSVAGMTGNGAGTGAVDITSLFDVKTDETNHRIEINLKKSGVTATDGTTGPVDLKKSYTLYDSNISFHPNSKIVVYYTATLNSNAVVGPTGNANMATLEFRNAKGEYLTEYTPPDTVRVFTFKLQVKKWKDEVKTESLPGAAFTLYKDSKSNTNIVAKGTSDTNGVVQFSNLTTIGTGTYILSETSTPAGYNRMPDATITISAITDDPAADPKLKSVSVSVAGENITGNIGDNSTLVNIDVVNKPGSALPKTGGTGTTVLYITGICLITGAVILLFLRKKKIHHANEF